MAFLVGYCGTNLIESLSLFACCSFQVVNVNVNRKAFIGFTSDRQLIICVY